MAAADSTLLQSFMVCPAPGRSPMKKNFPITLSAGSTASTSARGPDAITATVPFSAPGTPPLTGASICTMFFAASSLKTRCAITAPVVERSTKRRTRLAFDHAIRPGRDFEHDVGRRQAHHHGLGGVGDFLRRARRDRAQRGEIADRFLARVVDEDLVPGLDQPARHVRAHIAETDEADVHDFLPRYFAPIVAGMNSARTFSVCSPSAGTGP